jgi:L-2-hydroxycarboxylate dehydrogenase (NAD+)
MDLTFSATPPLRFPLQDLKLFAAEVFLRDGVPQVDAVQAAEVLCTADEWGIRSHGLARLRAYHDSLVAGRVNPVAKPRITRDSPSVIVLDADNGLGLVTAPVANRMAMERAHATGAAWVSVFNSNHFGIAGYYAVQGLDQDLVGMAMTNTPPLVAPLWGARRTLGTNPIAFAFPADKEPPVVVDMSTSAISLGAVEVASRVDSDLPAGCAANNFGQPTLAPSDFFAGGMLLPLGGARESGGHKGYCLAALVDLLCGPLAGAAWGPFIAPFPIGRDKPPEPADGKGIGHLFGAYSISAFSDPRTFRQTVDEWVRTMRTTPPQPGSDGPIIPGDPERFAAEQNRRRGVDLEPKVIMDLNHLGIQLDIQFHRF